MLQDAEFIDIGNINSVKVEPESEDETDQQPSSSVKFESKDDEVVTKTEGESWCQEQKSENLEKHDDEDVTKAESEFWCCDTLKQELCVTNPSPSESQINAEGLPWGDFPTKEEPKEVTVEDQEEILHEVQVFTTGAKKKVVFQDVHKCHVKKILGKKTHFVRDRAFLLGFRTKPIHGKSKIPHSVFPT
ncbi:uncharacterized protein [Periplaneta americana]|uniref:uncharacterized protein isoform X4 n=1 Tax=Periplaneta americana TaxID=6978 RepID=UPI0037E918DD